MIKLTKAILAIFGAASKDETRYSVHCLNVEESGIVAAANGHILAVHLPSGEIEPETQSVSIPANAVKRLDKAMRKTDEAEVQERSIETNAGTSIEFEPLDSDFPDWRQVMPGKNALPTLAVDARLLKQACEIAIKASGRKLYESVQMNVTLGPNPELDPIRIDVDAEGSAKVVLVVMPMRL